MHLPGRQSGVVQSLSYGLANVAGSIFSAISLIILSRALGPANFGAFSVAFSLTQIFARLADFGLSVSLQKFIAKNYRHDADSVAAAVYWAARIKLISAIAAVIFGLLFGHIIGTRLFNLAEPRFATLGIVLASIIIFYEFTVLLHQSIHQFKIAAGLNAIQAGLKFLLGLAVLYLVLPSAYLCYVWYGLLPLFAAIFGFSRLPAKYRRRLTLTPAQSAELLTTAKYSYVAALAITVADQLDVLMVKSILNEFQTGLYAAASRISLLFTMFASSIGTVLYTRVARYKGKDLRLFYTKCLYTSLGLVLLTPLLLLLAKPLLLISAGTAYLDALATVRLLLLSTTLTMATVPLVAPFYSLDYPRYFMYTGLLQILLLVAGNFYFLPMLGIAGAAWAKIVMRTVVLLYTLVVSYTKVKAHHETI